MKKLVWQVVLPITIISFAVFTKWWYVLPVDAPDTMMNGFPLIWLSEGWHTSMSLQIFVLEFLVNLLLWFLFWFIIVIVINQYVYEVSMPRGFILLAYMAVFFIGIFAWRVGTMTEHIYTFKRDFEVEVLDSGYKFIWQYQKRPVYKDYKNKKPE